MNWGCKKWSSCADEKTVPMKTGADEKTEFVVKSTDLAFKIK